MSPIELTQDTRARALRASLWLALVHAQELGCAEIENQLARLLSDVDQRSDRFEDTDAACRYQLAANSRRRGTITRVIALRRDKRLDTAT